MGRWDLVCALLLVGCGDKDSDGTVTDADDDGVAVGDDCNDSDAAIHPGADERCNQIDDDCDGDVDDAPIDAMAVFVDADADGYGNEKAGTACVASEGEAAVDGDCDDENPAIHPGATEICNAGIDDDCNGLADDEEGVASTDYYVDADKDGFGGGDAMPSCDPDPGLTAVAGDCDDKDAEVHPGAIEVCNGVDDDCDAATPETGMVALGSDNYTSIQDAVDDAAEGETVLICDGTFYENVVIDHSVVLEGMGADVSIIDGGSAAQSVVGLATDDWWKFIDLRVRGLTLQNGTGDPISGGTTLTFGGGIQADGASVLVVEDCVIANNTAKYGGGVRGSYYGQTLLKDSTFRGNTASFWGGGAYLTSSPTSLYGAGGLDIEGCEFLDNTAGETGGGIAIRSAKADGNVTITDTLIDGNATTGGVDWEAGGGLSVGADTLTLSGVTISNNESLLGGGVYSGADDVIADDKTVVTGNATHDGGSGGGCYCTSDWLGGTFESNTAATGGGVYLWGSGQLDGVTIEGNLATALGGGVLMDVYTEIHNSVITANASDGVGGGIGTTEYDPPYDTLVADSTITANAASVSGGGARVQMTFESDNCDWGEKATDNTPDDVSFVDPDGDIRSYDGLGAGEDFICDLDPGRCR